MLSSKHSQQKADATDTFAPNYTSFPVISFCRWPWGRFLNEADPLLLSKKNNNQCVLQQVKAKNKIGTMKILKPPSFQPAALGLGTSGLGLQAPRFTVLMFDKQTSNTEETVPVNLFSYILIIGENELFMLDPLFLVSWVEKS